MRRMSARIYVTVLIAGLALLTIGATAIYEKYRTSLESGHISITVPPQNARDTGLVFDDWFTKPIIEDKSCVSGVLWRDCN